MNARILNPQAPHAGSLPPLLPRFDRLAIAGALMAIAVLGWVYLWVLARGMGGDTMPAALSARAMTPAIAPWTGADFALTFVMWWVMMIGMMLPSATPMILMFRRISRTRRAKGKSYVPVAVFAAAYVIAWGGYSLAATLAQWGLEQAALMAPMRALTHPALGGAVWLAAGAYQLTPLKTACLRHCRSPLSFVLNHWRDGPWGAWVMGAGHGSYCLGCCWFLMTLLFVGGVMHLLWVAAIAAFVLAEKLFPHGDALARVSGLLMAGWGGYLLLHG